MTSLNFSSGKNPVNHIDEKAIKDFIIANGTVEPKFPEYKELLDYMDKDNNGTRDDKDLCSDALKIYLDLLKSYELNHIELSDVLNRVAQYTMPDARKIKVINDSIKVIERKLVSAEDKINKYCKSDLGLLAFSRRMNRYFSEFQQYALPQQLINSALSALKVFAQQKPAVQSNPRQPSIPLNSVNSTSSNNNDEFLNNITTAISVLGGFLGVRRFGSPAY